MSARHKRIGIGWARLRSLRAASSCLAAILFVPVAAASGDAHGQEQDEIVVEGEVLVADSVCSAHELRAMQAEDPSLQIEIPPEFAGQWPSADACRSAALAWEPEAPGPIQPIPFSHKHHAGTFEIECQYCHSNTGDSPSAGMPSVELCMGCHSQFPPTYDEIEGIRILKEHWAEKKPIEWIQIHRLPEYVQFRHNRHIKAGLDCQRCHGPVEDLDKLYLVPDSGSHYFMPYKKLEMGWCINCHRDNDHQASQDCLRCHY